MNAPTTGMVLLVNRQGETVRVGHGRVLVASKTTTGVWYDVSAGECQCKGFRFYGRCRHLACNPNRPEPPTPTSPASCPRCQRPTTAVDARSLATLSQCARCVNEMLYGPDEVA